ncbi:MAG: hypothetical protein F6J94_16845 [Moorea sp. SIO1F2]|uniref:hypothetical protein n=1 Tax=unclassified Moorena TaxID=2683338 RepID=UPI0013B626DC|nr:MULTISPECIES: hypothetical protein [unclassified Moorena]NEO23388.1 hypothetical protein [Moorena sp. SIO4A5]NEO51520.1 hypothetical protein [Moorena sp. SIO4A3]NEQ58601.1 hypothetical protein [Moorena sp. SIO4A1]NET83524.1 hypothetical protein [Moorena sp. SIO1F2]
MNHEMGYGFGFCRAVASSLRLPTALMPGESWFKGGKPMGARARCANSTQGSAVSRQPFP